MSAPEEKSSEFNPADLPAFPPTDETGDVDLSLIDYNLSLTVAERIRQHNEALKLVLALERVGKERYGSDARTLEPAE